MSHTNTTSNYSLPQFIGTDKPAWLTDVNGAMSAIDAQMKLNADSATTATSSATTANTNIGTLSDLNTTSKSSVVSAVNEVNTNLGTVSGVASSANSTATTANNKANSIEAYFTFNNNDSASVSFNAGSIENNNLRYASNADGTCGKIYGVCLVNMTTSTTGKITFSTPFRPTENINIIGAGILSYYGGSGGSGTSAFDMTIKTTGEVEITIDAVFYTSHLMFYFPPCVYFMQNFGD